MTDAMNVGEVAAEVPCPLCHAGAGWPCTGSSMHPARYAAGAEEISRRRAEVRAQLARLDAEADGHTTLDTPLPTPARERVAGVTYWPRSC
jgi:hypothetical protein